MPTTDNNIKGIVLHTDGSCRPVVPGYIGWGCHGYLYETHVVKTYELDKHILTKTGYAPVDSNSIPVQPLEFYDFCGSDAAISTNNKAELLAFVRSVEHVKDKDFQSILIRTDSDYLCKGINEWSKSWERNNWRKQDGKEVPNSIIWKQILVLVKYLKDQGKQFEIKWIKAHNGHKGNEEADQLAVIGMLHSTHGDYKDHYLICPAKDYTKSEVERHPFISFRRMYFNSVNEFNKPGHYYISDPGVGDYVVGKRNPDAGFSVVRLTNPDLNIEAIRNKQCKVADNANAICMIRLDAVYSPKINKMLQNYGEHCVLRGRRDLLDLICVDNTPVTAEMNPTGLSLRAIEAFNYLEEMLDRYLLLKEIGFDHPSNKFNLKSHEVTNEFYDLVSKKVRKEEVTSYILKAEHKMGLNNTYLTVKELVNDKLQEIRLPIVYGTDILPRNNLKKLESEAPAINVITWRESMGTLRYATIVDCAAGVGIWSNFFADKVFLPT